MAALTQTRDTETLDNFIGPAIPILNVPVAAGKTLQQGGMVQASDGSGITPTAGTATPAGTGAQGPVLGMFRGATPNVTSPFTAVSNTGSLTNSGADGAISAEVARGTFGWDSDGTIVPGDLGKTVYAVDDHTVSHGNGGNTRGIAGKVVQIDYVGAFGSAVSKVWVETLTFA